MNVITKLAIVMVALAFSLSLILTSSLARSSTVGGGQVAPALYGSKCSLCHGKDGTGVKSWKSKGIPNFTDAQWHGRHTDEQISEVIRNGKGKYMPPFGKQLSDEQISALVAAVRRFKK